MKTIFSWDNFSLAGITLIRIFTGLFILRYGRELFHIQDLLNFLKDEKVPFPVFTGYAAKIIELAGGAMLMVGLFTRWVTPPLIVVMIGVIYTTANGNIFEGQFSFLFILLFAMFFFTGGGKWSLDYLITKRIFNKNKS
jgi:putative oxidoreductase